MGVIQGIVDLIFIMQNVSGIYDLWTESDKSLNRILMYWVHFKALWSQTDLTKISQNTVFIWIPFLCGFLKDFLGHFAYYTFY